MEDEIGTSFQEDGFSQAGSDVPRSSGIGLPLKELLALLNEYLPQAFTQEAATIQQPSYFWTLQAALQSLSATRPNTHTYCIPLLFSGE